MTALSAKELAALDGAGSFGPDFDQVVLLREARQLRAQVLKELVGRGLSRVAALLGRDGLGGHFARLRLYRRTLVELSRLDERALQDIGINRGEIEPTARAAVGLDAQTRPGLFARLRQAAAEAREHRRAAQDLAALDRRLLQDIGVEPDGIEHYVDEARRYGGEPRPVLVTATPALAFDLLFPAGNRASVGWGGEPRPAANRGDEAARAA